MDPNTPIQFLKGAGPAKSEKLEKLDLHTVGDLVSHFPRAYLDRTRLSPLSRLQPGKEATSVGTIRSTSARQTRGRMRNLHVILEDDSGAVEVVWFNQPYLTKLLRPGRRLLVSGTVDYFRRLQFRNPEFELLDEIDETDASAPGIVPVYPLTAGISQRLLRRLVASALDQLLPGLEEFMPPRILQRQRLIEWREAHERIHRPDTSAAIEDARRRIAFQELFDLQLMLAVARRQARRPRTGWALTVPGRLLEGLLAAVPFRPTRAQERVIEEIRADLASDSPMHRLLEGDVGCGKTFVAMAAALLAVEGGAPVAFMVPTELPAQQHARTRTALGGALAARVASPGWRPTIRS